MGIEKVGCCSKFVENSQLYFAMIFLQFVYGGMNIITKVSLNQGMSHYVLVVYRHVFATVAIAPFAIIFERKHQPRITFPIFIQIFILALLGMEKMNIKKVRCQAKVMGTVFTVGGAMVMTLYKGPIVEMVWTKHHRTKINNTQISSDKQWFIGSIFIILSTLAWASLFVLQAKVIETYKNHQLSLTSLICFIGIIQAAVVTFLMERKTSVWLIGWDMNLLAAAYAGVFSSSMSYYVQGLVMQKKGPVFATAFIPLMMIIVAIMGSFILAEQIYLGGVVGAILIIIGLYSVLWGKNKEQIMENKVTDENLSFALKCVHIIDGKNSNQNAEAPNKLLSLPHSHMNVINQEENKVLT
ncbi:WAT1-related protein At5g07050-like isoform X2 [Arachis ipaensis]|uniref:WAT1-related protein At5g07050-like isoform X2 n=1 Tax=Arachis ipaensis TaxID=130454 RepID=UPI000A2B8064|nr:WAT1-related protein At5g07050-like isoform X2 [Arachis ipaensis]XP_025681189.1 WAT1-related protein At5g07050 isoform X2 [Arachis hypogaea]QHO04810.1 WAT1-related protein [Arachis hypogaea]